MDDLIKTVAPLVIDALTPVIMLVLTAGVTQLMNALRNRFDSQEAHALLEHVEKAAQLAVREAEQTLMPKIREAIADDGKLDREDLYRIKQHVLTQVKVYIGPKARRQLLVENTGSKSPVIDAAIEAAVHKLKTEKSNSLDDLFVPAAVEKM